MGMVMNKLAQNIYLEILLARGHEWQNPEYINARWYHLLLLPIPIVGLLLFIEFVKARNE